MTAVRGSTIATVALLVLVAGTVGAESLEEETRRPPGASSLSDDSERLRGNPPDDADSDTQDNDSMELRGRTADQDGTNSLDDGSLDGGNAPDPD
jgi:hypothetical protein